MSPQYIVAESRSSACSLGVKWYQPVEATSTVAPAPAHPLPDCTPSLATEPNALRVCMHPFAANVSVSLCALPAASVPAMTIPPNAVAPATVTSSVDASAGCVPSV